MRDFKYIYGPVFSWRLGVSLGIDPLGGEKKICSFDCIYCQIGKTDILRKEREEFVPTEKIIKEIESLPHLKIDYITFSGMGEPILAKNLAETVKAIKGIRKERIAILTNSSLMDREDVRRDLSLFDLVVAKLDVYSQDSLERINRPAENIKFERILEGIKKFKKKYKKKLAIQIMFLEENKDDVKKIAKVVKEISPFSVQINTPLRPCRIKPLSKEEIYKIKEYFKELNAICVYDIKKKKVLPIDKEETLKRRKEI
jgi:wyosine [tRNA(Phe)-imidazoG37] synthetase (radical SAM superfamily)